MSKKFYNIVDEICEKDPRYNKGAYAFVMEALSYTQKRYKKERHVTGQELLRGIKNLLMEKFGPMTLTVLKYWGIESTEDFGKIIFTLVDSKVLSKTEEDTFKSFQNGYDFKEVFERGYRKKLHNKIKRM